MPDKKKYTPPSIKPIYYSSADVPIGGTPSRMCQYGNPVFFDCDQGGEAANYCFVGYVYTPSSGCGNGTYPNSGSGGCWNGTTAVDMGYCSNGTDAATWCSSGSNPMPMP